MNAQVLPFELDDLRGLKPLLDESAGYSVSIEDEVDYFDPIIAATWFRFVSDQQTQGFIRCFPQKTWGRLELYAKECLEPAQKSLIRTALLKKFLIAAGFEKNFRLRLELSSLDQLFVDAAKELGFCDRVENFFTYEKSLKSFEVATDSAFSATRLAVPGEASILAEVFANLHPVTADEILDWILDGEVFVLPTPAGIFTAAHVRISDCKESAEIVRISTRADQIRRGFAEQLLKAIHRFLGVQGTKQVTLQVDAEKAPARALYEKLGYRHNETADQVWLSKIF